MIIKEFCYLERKIKAVYTALYRRSFSDYFPAFSAGLGPVPRRLTNLLSMSNQKGAPCMAARAVMKTPTSLRTTFVWLSACGGTRHLLERRSGIPNVCFPLGNG